MNKKRILAIVVVLGLLAVVSVPLINLANGAPSGTSISRVIELTPNMAPVVAVLETSCANCHTLDTTMPFYAGFPVAGTIVAEDIERGRRFFDLAAGLMPEPGVATVEPTLARIEWQVESGQMPPLRYRLLHWDAGLGKTQRATLTQWIEQTRIARFAPDGLKPELAVQAVHPLPGALPIEVAKAKLGKRLYFDTRLSGDGTVSCASCHDLSKGGTDQLPVSVGIKGQKGGINSPTTFNAAFNVAQFWDGRAATLEAQAAGPPLNPIEMGANWEGIIAALSADQGFSAEFNAVYPQGLSEQTISHAIAEYERTLLTPNAPFDRFLRRETGAISDRAAHGWELFKSNGCHTCHVGKGFGGQSFEKIGRARDYFAERQTPKTEADDGRYNVTKREADRHRFKVPLLRNIADTFPYYHDGSIKDLGTAVGSMARVQLDRDLNPDQIGAIVDFLNTLTGVYTDRFPDVTTQPPPAQETKSPSN